MSKKRMGELGVSSGGGTRAPSFGGISNSYVRSEGEIFGGLLKDVNQVSQVALQTVDKGFKKWAEDDTRDLAKNLVIAGIDSRSLDQIEGYSRAHRQGGLTRQQFLLHAESMKRELQAKHKGYESTVDQVMDYVVGGSPLKSLQKIKWEYDTNEQKARLAASAQSRKEQADMRALDMDVRKRANALNPPFDPKTTPVDKQRLWLHRQQAGAVTLQQAKINAENALANERNASAKLKMSDVGVKQQKANTAQTKATGQLTSASAALKFKYDKLREDSKNKGLKRDNDMEKAKVSGAALIESRGKQASATKYSADKRAATAAANRDAVKGLTAAKTADYQSKTKGRNFMSGANVSESDAAAFDKAIGLPVSKGKGKPAGIGKYVSSPTAEKEQIANLANAVDSGQVYQAGLTDGVIIDRKYWSAAHAPLEDGSVAPLLYDMKAMLPHGEGQVLMGRIDSARTAAKEANEESDAMLTSVTDLYNKSVPMGQGSETGSTDDTAMGNYTAAFQNASHLMDTNATDADLNRVSFSLNNKAVALVDKMSQNAYGTTADQKSALRTYFAAARVSNILNRGLSQVKEGGDTFLSYMKDRGGKWAKPIQQLAEANPAFAKVLKSFEGKDSTVSPVGLRKFVEAANSAVDKEKMKQSTNLILQRTGAYKMTPQLFVKFGSTSFMNPALEAKRKTLEATRNTMVEGANAITLHHEKVAEAREASRSGSFTMGMKRAASQAAHAHSKSARQQAGVKMVRAGARQYEHNMEYRINEFTPKFDALIEDGSPKAIAEAKQMLADLKIADSDEKQAALEDTLDMSNLTTSAGFDTFMKDGSMKKQFMSYANLATGARIKGFETDISADQGLARQVANKERARKEPDAFAKLVKFAKDARTAAPDIADSLFKAEGVPLKMRAIITEKLDGILAENGKISDVQDKAVRSGVNAAVVQGINMMSVPPEQKAKLSQAMIDGNIGGKDITLYRSMMSPEFMRSAGALSPDVSKPLLGHLMSITQRHEKKTLDTIANKMKAAGADPAFGALPLVHNGTAQKTPYKIDRLGRLVYSASSDRDGFFQKMNGHDQEAAAKVNRMVDRLWPLFESIGAQGGMTSPAHKAALRAHLTDSLCGNVFSHNLDTDPETMSLLNRVFDKATK